MGIPAIGGRSCFPQKIGMQTKCGEPSNWFSAVSLKLDRSVGGGIFRRFFSNFEKCRLEVADGLISDVTVD